MENLEQLTMFGVDPNPEYVFDVYHDESGTYHRLKGDRWLLHGVLFVPTDKKPDVGKKSHKLLVLLNIVPDKNRPLIIRVKMMFF